MHLNVITVIYSRVSCLLSRRHLLLPVALAFISMMAIILATSWSALAAVELAYFTASSTSNSVLLEWGTVQEFNLDGFEILCKRATEPDTAYHPIGARIAQGGPEQGAEYSLSVTTGIEFGTPYCFRLVEKTSDGTPGEQFDICGYGPGITPTAVLTTTLIDAAENTPTTIVVESPPGATPAPTLEQTPTATFTETPMQGVSPVSNPTATDTQTPTPTATQPDSPLGQVESTPASVEDGVGADPAQASFPETEATPSVTPTLTPTLTATPLQTDTPTISPTPTETLTVTPTSTALAESAAATFSPTPTLDPAALAQEPGGPGSSGVGGGEEPTATPLYVVVTATPTPELLAMTVPTFTPWPSATPVPAFNFANFMAPTTQNLMVMLLCLIFLSASGLGTLGLITSILYMRSQAKRSRYPTTYVDRRRY